MGVMSLLEAAAKFEAIGEDIEDAEKAIVAEIALKVYDLAREVIGTYLFGWPPLQPETVARKGGDTPLLETGEMRDSIEMSFEDDGKKAHVGSNDDKAVWQELGTSRIPPRSFLGGAAMRVQAEVPAIVHKHMAEAFAGGGAAMQGLNELLHAIHALRGAYHQAKGMFTD
jgi:phage gpG-like protein